MATEATQPSPGSWVDIPIDDNVISLARWAVDEHNKQGARLEFRGVWTAREQIVEGTRYSIVLSAADEGFVRRYVAQVLVPLTGDKVLEDFYAIEREA